MMKLAFASAGMLVEPRGNPAVQGFVDRVPAVYGAAEGSDGFRARSVRDIVTLEHSWGPVKTPKCYGGGGDSLQFAATLSTWDDLESVAAFAYHGAHGEALMLRKDWFEARGLPGYAAWWIDEEQKLGWNDACERIDHLHQNGSTPFSFNFSQAFDAEGKPYKLDTALVKLKIAANASRELGSG
jgi:hypothetical protein